MLVWTREKVLNTIVRMDVELLMRFWYYEKEALVFESGTLYYSEQQRQLLLSIYQLSVDL